MVSNIFKRVSPKWRLMPASRARQDELSALGEAQWHVSPNVFIRLNNSFGLTSKASTGRRKGRRLFTRGRDK
jgi:hypothetical protein